VGALALGGKHLATGQCSGLEDGLEAKLRFVVDLLRGLLCLRSSSSAICLFWMTHFDLIAVPIGRLVRPY